MLLGELIDAACAQDATHRRTRQHPSTGMCTTILERGGREAYLHTSGDPSEFVSRDLVEYVEATLGIRL